MTMTFEPRSVYEFGDVPRAPWPPVAPILVPAPSPLPTVATFTQSIAAIDGALYTLTYRLVQRPAAWVGVLESCCEVRAGRG